MRAIIVDDEKNGRENLAGMLKTHCQWIELAGSAASVSEAVELIHSVAPDLVFLDIEMPGANGFQLLEHFIEFRFEVIFVTAHDQYAIQAIRFSAADYILKPIDPLELKSAVEKVAGRVSRKNEDHRLRELHRNLFTSSTPRIGLPTDGKVEFTEAGKIVRCQGESNYTHIWFESGRHLLVAKTLAEFEELLAGFGFFRVHKSHLVNLGYILSLKNGSNAYLILKTGEEIPVSRRRRETVIEMVREKGMKQG
jgi:two-component system LytT family response regulator